MIGIAFGLIALFVVVGLYALAGPEPDSPVEL
jgi:hypothetical protein